MVCVSVAVHRVSTIEHMLSFLLVLHYSYGSQEESVGTTEVAKTDAVQASQTVGKSSQSIFRSVTELSLGDNKSSGIAAVDMVYVTSLSLFDISSCLIKEPMFKIVQTCSAKKKLFKLVYRTKRCKD